MTFACSLVVNTIISWRGTSMLEVKSRTHQNVVDVRFLHSLPELGCDKTLVDLDIILARHIDSNCDCTVILAYSIQASQDNRLNTDTCIRIPSKPEY